MVSMKRREYLRYGGAFAGLSLATSASAGAQTDDGDDEPETYEPTWESLEKHDVPEWFDDAKLGIFIHWGPYSVPGWAPVGEYAEWYPSNMHYDGSATNGYHNENYGDPVPGTDEDETLSPFEYKDFIRDTDDSDAPENFDAAEWDPDRWADLFEEIGAGYVVPVGEHHDGFAMWDTDQTDWNAAQTGPQRDIIEELSEAVRDRGMKFAASYHRMMNYYDPRYTGLYGNPNYDGSGPDAEFVEEWAERWYDLMEHVKPDLLWWDGDWMAPVSTWGSKKLVADYYNTAKHEWDKEVVVNDRLGQVRGERGDFFTPEYEKYDHILAHKWEATRGIGYSFGYNRQETAEDYLSVTELVQSFVDIVSKNGNLLLNVGPKKNGRIPEIQKERLRGLGKWLDVNGEAIFGSDYWVVPEDETGGGEVRYTTKNNQVYAVLFDWPGETARLSIPKFVDMKPGFRVEMLGSTSGNEGHRYLDWEVVGDELVVRLPDEKPDGEHAEHAYTLKVQVAHPDENAFEHAAANANGSSKIVESKEKIRDIVQTPDLQTDLTVTGASEATVTVSATVTNDGNAPAPATSIRFEAVSDGTTTLATREVPNLGVNQSTELSAEWDVSDLPSGAYEVRTTIDPDDRIGEISEADNSATVGVLLPLTSLEGEWQFHRGDDTDWKRPDFDDSGWQAVQLPRNWEDHSGYTKDPAYGWYRKTFTVPEEWAGYDLQIPLGKIDDVDETFVNGTKVGQSGTFPDDFATAWSQVRKYTVPAEDVNFGSKNVVAIRVYDGQGGGGLYDGPLGPIGVDADS